MSAKLNGNSIDTTIKRQILFSIEKSRKNKKGLIADSTVYECLLYSVPVNLNDKHSVAQMQEEMNLRKAAKVLYDKGVAELKNNNAAGALDLFNQAEKQGFHDIDLFYNRGVANLRTGNKEPACADWLEAARKGDAEALKLYDKMCK